MKIHRGDYSGEGVCSLFGGEAQAASAAADGACETTTWS